MAYDPDDKFVNPRDGVEFVRHEPSEAQLEEARRRVAAGEDPVTVAEELAISVVALEDLLG